MYKRQLLVLRFSRSLRKSSGQKEKKACEEKENYRTFFGHNESLKFLLIYMKESGRICGGRNVG